MKKKILILTGLMICLAFAACGDAEGGGSGGTAASEAQGVSGEGAEDSGDVNGEADGAGADASDGGEGAEPSSVSEAAAFGLEGADETEQAVEIPSYQIGDTASLGNWQITVMSMELLDSLSEDNIAYQSNEEGDKLARATVTVTNSGAEEDTFLPSYASTEDIYVQLLCGEEMYLSSKFLGYSQDLHDMTLEPSETKSGKILFEISGEAADASAELLMQFYCGSEAVSFEVR